MALSDIFAEIDNQTAKTVEKLKKDFEEKKKALEKKANERQKEIDENIHKKIEEKSEKIVKKAEDLGKNEAKNQLLSAKRQVIESTLEETVKALAKSDKYEEIIANMLKKIDIDGEEAVVIPAKGKEEATKKALKESGKKFLLSDKATDISGGFLLKTDKMEVDSSFETIIKFELRESLEIEINKLLFNA